MDDPLRCIYCKSRGLQLTRTQHACKVQCVGCGHVWRAAATTSDQQALRLFAIGSQGRAVR